MFRLCHVMIEILCYAMFCCCHVRVSLIYHVVAMLVDAMMLLMLNLIHVSSQYHAMLSFCYEIGCCRCLVLALSCVCLDAMYLVVLQVHSMY